MGKVIRRITACFLLAALFWCGGLLCDRYRLRQNLIRLHVVANSDTFEDQQRKLMVRDAVTASLEKELQNVKDTELAKLYLQEKLPYIQLIAENTLQALGCKDEVIVSLCREAFDTRVYDTFTLPAGVYNALRIVIGEGQGRNWWCVVFPSLCIPVTSESFEDTAAAAGFPEELNHALTGEDGYELRFAILDVMGRLENILFQG